MRAGGAAGCTRTGPAAGGSEGGGLTISGQQGVDSICFLS